MDESQQELFRSALYFPTRGGRELTTQEQRFVDRMQSRYPEQCHHIRMEMAEELVAAKAMHSKIAGDIEAVNKLLDSEEAVVRVAQRQSAWRRSREQLAAKAAPDFRPTERLKMGPYKQETTDACEAARDAIDKAVALNKPLLRFDPVLGKHLFNEGELAAVMKADAQGDWVAVSDVRRVINEANEACSAVLASMLARIGTLRNT